MLFPYHVNNDRQQMAKIGSNSQKLRDITGNPGAQNLKTYLMMSRYGTRCDATAHFIWQKTSE